MALYVGTNKVNPSGIGKVYVGTNLVYQAAPVGTWHTIWTGSQTVNKSSGTTPKNIVTATSAGSYIFRVTGTAYAQTYYNEYDEEDGNAYAMRFNPNGVVWFDIYVDEDEEENHGNHNINAEECRPYTDGRLIYVEGNDSDGDINAYSLKFDSTTRKITLNPGNNRGTTTTYLTITKIEQLY